MDDEAVLVRACAKSRAMDAAGKPGGDDENVGLPALLAAFGLSASTAFAQVGFPPPPPKVSPAAGVIDMHVHSHPDVFGRNMDDIDVARIAQAKGMRGIVLKNHVATTADRAALTMKVVPGIEVFGGIVLNKAVGGINPDAVEWMHRMYGGRGKIVWLPTFDADKHVKTLVSKDGSGLLVAPGGRSRPRWKRCSRSSRARISYSRPATFTPKRSWRSPRKRASSACGTSW